MRQGMDALLCHRVRLLIQSAKNSGCGFREKWYNENNK